MRRPNYSLFFIVICLAIISTTFGVPPGPRPRPGRRPQTSERVVAFTLYGAVSGFLAPTHSGDSTRSTAKVFLGVPFARPPTGALRFEKPQPPSQWTPAVRDASQYASACYQISKAMMFGPDVMTYSEDCLYLNIIAPNWSNTGDWPNGFPVLVYIHGGGFEIGEAIDYRYEFFAKHYLPRDVLIVTIQYRLAQFGFLNLADDDLPGNYGLWDQVAALKFIKNNIALFGGDPNRVTIFGHSAGGASVGHLTASPHADRLFARAVQLSGSPFAEWATSDRNESSKAMAKELGCDTAKCVKTCLQSKTADQLLAAADKIGIYRHNALNMFIFAPRIDGDFHPYGTIAEALAASKSKRPVLIGCSDGEGIEFTIGRAFSGLSDLYVAPSDYEKFTKDSFKDTITRLIANPANVGSSSDAQQLLDRIVTFYIDQAAQHAPPVQYADVGSATDGSFYVRQYSKVVSDLMFLVPTLVDAKTKAKAEWPTYLYRFGYLNMDQVYDENKPVYVVNTHTGEYPYIFDIYYDRKKVAFSEDDTKFQKNYVATICQFAKTGNPTTSVDWPKLNDNLLTLTHVELAPALASKDNVALFTKTLEFWQNIRIDFNFPDIRWFTEMIPDSGTSPSHRLTYPLNRSPNRQSLSSIPRRSPKQKLTVLPPRRTTSHKSSVPLRQPSAQKSSPTSPQQSPTRSRRIGHQ